MDFSNKEDPKKMSRANYHELLKLHADEFVTLGRKQSNQAAGKSHKTKCAAGQIF